MRLCLGWSVQGVRRLPVLSRRSPRWPFLPFWESLKSYRCPDWFRDAKFGIWAHWSPQCVPEQGDWYARNMYIQGQPQYEYHVKQLRSSLSVRIQRHLPSLESGKMGSRDTGQAIQARGRRVFRFAGHSSRQLRLLEFEVSAMELRQRRPEARHRGNLGQGRPLQRTAIWRELSRNASSHMGRISSRPIQERRDRTAGRRSLRWYANHRRRQGKWWEGMDPQMLNGKPHAKNTPCPEFMRQFMLRVQDVIDSYSPDILNFDDGAQFNFDEGGQMGSGFESVAWDSGSGAANHGLLLQQEYAGTCRPTGRSRGPQRGSRADLGHADTRLRMWHGG